MYSCNIVYQIKQKKKPQKKKTKSQKSKIVLFICLTVVDMAEKLTDYQVKKFLLFVIYQILNLTAFVT